MYKMVKIDPSEMCGHCLPLLNQIPEMQDYTSHEAFLFGKHEVKDCVRVSEPFVTRIPAVLFPLLSDAVGERHQRDPGRRDGTGEDHPVHRSHRHDDRKEGHGPLPGGGPALHFAQLDQ